MKKIVMRAVIVGFAICLKRFSCEQLVEDLYRGDQKKRNLNMWERSILSLSAINEIENGAEA